MNAIKELVALLQTIPEDLPPPELAVDVDGDLLLEWYFTKYNVVQLNVPTDGTQPYIVKYIKAAEEDGTVLKGAEYNLRKLPVLINLAKEYASND